MTEHNEPGSLPDTAGTSEVQKPGEYIRARRETAGMSQVQVSEALHLTVHYIKSLENDDYRKLPGLTFVKGYFRAYARLLKLDESEVLACYDQYVSSCGLRDPAHETSLGVARRSDQSVLWALVTGVLLAVGLGAGWWFFGRDEVRAPAAVVAVPSRSPETPATGTPAPAPVPAAPVSFGALETEETGAAAGFPGVDQPVADDPAGFAPADIEAPVLEPGTVMLMTEDGPVLMQEEATPAGGVVAASVSGEPATDADAAVVDAALANESTDAAQSQLPAAAATAGDLAATGVASAATQGARRVELVGNGQDRLELQFNSSSWVEVEDAARNRLYSEMMREGDTLRITAVAPFYILLGDATGVSVQLNDAALNIVSNIRSDNTARVRLAPDGVSTWVAQ